MDLLTETGLAARARNGDQPVVGGLVWCRQPMAGPFPGTGQPGEMPDAH